MKIIIYSPLVLCVFCSGLQAADKGIFIPGTSKEQIDEDHRKAIDAANAAINSQESNAPIIPELMRQHQEDATHPPPQNRAVRSQKRGATSQSYSAPPTRSYGAPFPPQYNPSQYGPYNAPSHNYGGTGGFSGSNPVSVAPAAPPPMPTPR